MDESTQAGPPAAAADEPETPVSEAPVSNGLARALASADAAHLEAGSRLGFLGNALKRLVRRLIRFHLVRQTEFNRSAAEAVGEAERYLRRHGEHLGRLSSTLEGVGRALAAQGDHLGKVSAMVESRGADQDRLQALAGELHATLHAQGEHLDDLETRLAELRVDIEKRQDEQRAFEVALRSDQDALEKQVLDLDARFRPRLTFDHFDFTRRYRGDEAELKERLRVFAGLFGAVERVLEIGCGRGEFLELCGELGVGAYGIDVDPDMVGRCRMKGLNAHELDALEHLRGIDDRSLDGIFMSQVIEHMTAAEILELVQLAARKLKRGALFISETLNPDTFTALRWYWSDLTHRQPVPADTIRFLLEDAGFTLRDVLYRSPLPDAEMLGPLAPPPSAENAALAELVRGYNRNVEKLNRVLFGAQDYAVIAER